MSFTKSCGPCGGSGYYGANPKDTCKVCNGLGEIALDGHPTGFRPCGPCGGSGYYGANAKDTCQICKGVGLVPLTARTDKASRVKTTTPVLNPDATKSPKTPRVFLVHGRNQAVRNEIDLYLSKDLQVKTVVMEAGPQKGRSLPEKFEEMSADCDFAVFIMTADDVLLEAESKRRVKRARQNVVLEIGYFWGAMGRRNRVAFLVDNDSEMELPSDIQGLGWIPITPDLAETKMRLRQELLAAGVIE